jgi:L-ribulose-5-phosphate 4-epimerase
MSEFKYLKERCLDANLQIKTHNLAIYTFGNVSVIDRSLGVFAIKPSGVPYQKLIVNDIVILNLEGKILEGDLRPSSDTKTHLYLYNKWSNINSICHTHSTYAVGWAQSLLSVPVYGTTHADHLTNEIPCTEPMDDELIQGDYEHNTGIQIENHFLNKNLNPDHNQMCLVGSHGPFSWGKDENESVYNSVVLEELCKMAFITKTVNPLLGSIKKSLIEKHYLRKHGKNSYYGQN